MEMNHSSSGFGLKHWVRFDGHVMIPAEQVWLLDLLFAQINSMFKQEPF